MPAKRSPLLRAAHARRAKAAIEADDPAELSQAIGSSTGRARLDKDTPLLCAAACSGAMRCAALLLEAGASVEEGGAYFGGPLSLAAQRGKDPMAAFLLTAGARVDARKGPTANTPLILAAGAGHLATVELLLAHGADVNLTGGLGATALMCAALGESLECVEALLAAGAELGPRTFHGDTAKSLASRRGAKQILCVLERHELAAASSAGSFASVAGPRL